MANEPRLRLRPLVLDSSVAINLLATERPWEILAALGYQACVAEQVLGEVARCPITKHKYEHARHPFRLSPNVDIVRLNDVELEDFVEIAQSVGDGEAASIALAIARHWPLALDDRRARVIARRREPGLSLKWTTELLRAEAVVATFSSDEVGAFYAAALKHARMYVPPT